MPEAAVVIDEEFLTEGAQNPVLGPHYFAARKIAGDFMARFEADHFGKLIQKAADDFYSKLNENLHDYLLGDVEGNLQGSMWRQIDGSVQALLSGERWALERYALGSRYDHDKIREAVAKHIPVELQDARVADLEEKLKQANQTIEDLRRRY